MSRPHCGAPDRLRQAGISPTAIDCGNKLDTGARANHLASMRAVFLDMGSRMYGDCVFIDLDGFTILIDGGHPQDFSSGANVPAQLKRITGNAKINVDLLVVTHSHDDHVGCLPRMVEENLLSTKFALVSDPAHRWPADGDHDAVDLGPNGRPLLDVLGEE